MKDFIKIGLEDYEVFRKLIDAKDEYNIESSVSELYINGELVCIYSENDGYKISPTWFINECKNSYHILEHIHCPKCNELNVIMSDDGLDFMTLYTEHYVCSCGYNFILNFNFDVKIDVVEFDDEENEIIVGRNY